MSAEADRPHGTSAERRYDELLARALRGDSIESEGEGEPWLAGLKELARRAVPAPEPALEVEPGLPWRELGGYRVIRRLGEGGMGVVYLAEQSGLGRRVALKVLRPELATSPTALERLAREARAIAKLRHPGIAAVHALGEDAGVRFFTMDLLDGEDLDAILARRLLDHGEGLPIPMALQIAAQVAAALDCAHAAGVLHRDVKPHNVRILGDGRAVLLDFGLARELGGEGASITREFAGSPSYAAPEQIVARHGARPDARADVWGLGATLYECLTGRAPFVGETIESVMHAVLHDEPVRPGLLRPSLPRDVETILCCALEKDPARRYPSMRAFHEDLLAVLELRVIGARAPGRWTVLRRQVRRHPRLAALALSAVAVVLLFAAESWLERRARGIEATQLVVSVQGELDAIETRRGAAERAGMGLHELEVTRSARSWTAAEAERASRLSAELAAFTRDRADVFARADANLASARRSAPLLDGLEDAYAQLYWQRWLEARQNGPRSTIEFFRERVAEHDRRGSWVARMRGHGSLRLTTEPAGAEVFLFQYAVLGEVVPGEEPRVVPMRALGAAERERPGATALRVVRAHDVLHAEDLVLELDGRSCDAILAATDAHALRAYGERGGARARVWRRGRSEELVLPAGLELRVTRAPLFVGEDRRVGVTPLVVEDLQPAWYVALVRRTGCEDLVLPFHVDHASEHFARCSELAVPLAPIGSTPRGFVRIAADAYAWGEVGFFMQERELSCAEYRAFVEDDPRDSGRWPLGEAWQVRDGSMEFVGDERAAATPVLGVSWPAARAFAQWADAHWQKPAGHGYRLPATSEWLRAGKGGDGRSFVFGNSFRDAWLVAAALPAFAPSPCMSWPTDESPFRIHDLAGNAAEWCDDEDIAMVCGGSWRDRLEAAFRLEARQLAPETRDAGIGFRLVLRPLGQTEPGTRAR